MNEVPRRRISFRGGSIETDRPTAGSGLLAWVAWLAPLGLIAVGLIIAAAFLYSHRWRRATVLFGAVAVYTAILRAILPTWRLGIFAVRGRWADVSFMLGTGVAILFLALSVDDLGT